jgi:hypothetical protein
MDASPVKGDCDQVADRESAYERLSGRVQSTTAAPIASDAGTSGTGRWQRPAGTRADAEPPTAPQPVPRQVGRQAKPEPSVLEQVIFGPGRRQGLAEAMAKSVVRTMGSQVGRQIVRGILGSILRGR